MVQLLADDIRTRDVLEWTGLHLFHFRGSSCSQKTRIVLSLKGCPWTSHEVDLRTNENFEPYYLGINPRGLVPTLVMDGAVHIESNDIIALIDARFPEPRLIPDGMEARVAELLRHEDDLHLDLRTLSFRFMFPLSQGAEVQGGAGALQGGWLGNGRWQARCKQGTRDRLLGDRGARGTDGRGGPRIGAAVPSGAVGSRPASRRRAVSTRTVTVGPRRGVVHLCRTAALVRVSYRPLTPARPRLAPGSVFTASVCARGGHAGSDARRRRGPSPQARSRWPDTCRRVRALKHLAWLTDKPPHLCANLTAGPGKLR